MMAQQLEERRHALMRAIQHDRDQLASAVEQLEEVVRSRASLGKRIAEKPYHWLGASLMLGIVLGSRRR